MADIRPQFKGYGGRFVSRLVQYSLTIGFNSNPFLPFRFCHSQCRFLICLLGMHGADGAYWSLRHLTVLSTGSVALSEFHLCFISCGFDSGRLVSSAQLKFRLVFRGHVKYEIVLPIFIAFPLTVRTDGCTKSRRLHDHRMLHHL